MAKVFLDTNYFIDAVHRKPEKQILDALENHIIYISTLSFHIYCYAFKIKIPNKRIIAQKEKFQAVEFSEDILEKSLNGPTTDFEDNIQLHSAASTDCDIFLTSDKKLLNLKFFGKTQVASNL